MTKGLRLSEKWFRWGLWAIALLFAAFLIGLGSLVVGDLPKVEKPLRAEQFTDQVKLRTTRSEIKALRLREQELNDEVSRSRQNAEHARAATLSEQESFESWIATRIATKQGSQNPEVLARQHTLDELRQAERSLEAHTESLETQQTELQQRKEALSRTESSLIEAGDSAYLKAVRRNELRVFGYRLLITLPLLLVAIWLFLKRRKSPRWPFVWGFIFFALFTFFFELVPYLPSYGGYLRYLVGIALTAWGGNYAIVAFRKYLDEQKASEQRPEEERRKNLGYEMAQMRLAKHICPACERPLDTADTSVNFCMHCGLLVYEHCARCNTRQTSFSHFCRACGLVKREAPPEEQQAPVPLAVSTT